MNAKMSPQELMAPIYAQIERERAGKTFVQLQIEDARYCLKRGLIPEGEALVIIMEPDEIVRHVRECGMTLDEYTAQAVSEAKDKDATTTHGTMTCPYCTSEEIGDADINDVYAAFNSLRLQLLTSHEQSRAFQRSARELQRQLDAVRRAVA